MSDEAITEEFVTRIVALGSNRLRNLEELAVAFDAYRELKAKNRRDGPTPEGHSR